MAVEDLFDHQYGRLREVQNGPDGALHFTTCNRDGRGSARQGDDRVLGVTRTSN